MSKVMVLPGTIWQVALIKKIKELGHEVYLVNPKRNEDVVVLADYFYESDIFAIDNIEKYAIRNKIDAIISDECDIAMPVVAELGKRLNVCTLSCEDAALYTDKYLMREFCKRHGLKSVEYRLCNNVEEAVSFLNEIGKPIIMKPLDSNASHGVFRVSTEKDLRDHFEESLSFSRVKKAVLVERYIIGTEFTVDGIKTPNGHFTLAISEKKHFKHNDSIANELYFTHRNSKYDYDKLKATNDDFVMNSNLRFGFTHAEYKYEDGEFYLIEIGARGGGNMISSVVTQFMSGYDTYKYLIECSLGNIQEADYSVSPAYIERAAILKFFKTPDGGGKVRALIGLDFLERTADINVFKFNFGVGDIIEDAKNDSARIGFYIACSENRNRLDEVIKLVDRNVAIETEANGK